MIEFTEKEVKELISYLLTTTPNRPFIEVLNMIKALENKISDNQTNATTK